jgi:2-polyprenyl-3-methyl-5-hydroxy-6-metoxy-1,4-benzoquinol methylase
VTVCPDPSCGLLWLDPMPLDEDLGLAYAGDYYTHQDDPPLTWPRRAYYWLRRGYLARRYGYHAETVPFWHKLIGSVIVLHPRRRADMEFTAMHLPAVRGGRLLEVGCGSGQALRVLGRLGWDAEGVDFDRAAVERARARGLRVRLGSLREQGYAAESFDAVVMSHLIEHVPDPLALLEECRRLLKPGGQLVVVTPNARSWGHTLFREHWFALDPPRHLVLFHLDTLRSLVEAAGLAVHRLVSTSRGARQIWIYSHDIRRTGTADMSRPPGIGRRLAGLAFEVSEAARLLVNPAIGEEILLVAAKE